MNQTSTDHQKVSDKGSSCFWGWGLATGLGTALGAYVAVLLVPEAGFAQITAGEYGIHLLEFALVIGVTLGVTQYLMLYRLMLSTSHTVNQWLFLWIPFTAIGVVVMIGPLWTFAAFRLMTEPWLAAFIMLPGMVLIGTGQWLILKQHELAGPNWIGRTIVGAFIGAFIGAISVSIVEVLGATFLGSAELIWAGCTGAGIGLLQGDCLSKAVGGHGSPPNLKFICVVLLILLSCFYLVYVLPAMHWVWH